MKFIFYLSLFILPFIALISGTVLAQQLVKEITSDILRSTAYAFLGLLICFGIFLLISKSLNKLSMKPMNLGRFSSVLWGLLIGLIVSLLSGVGFGLNHGYHFNFENLLVDLNLKLLGQSFPALCEEIVFRGGIVEGVMQLFGKYMGLAAGSIPFGILHLVGIFFGATVTLAQVIGISLAGLMLSLVYLRYGILGSFTCHLIWNSTVELWNKVYGINDKTTVSAIEGSWTTCIVLLVMCALLIVPLKKKK